MTTTRARGLAAALALTALAAASPAHAQDTAPCGDRYTAASGETLSAVAERCGVSLWALIQLNPGLGRGDALRAGQALRIPGARGADVRADAERAAALLASGRRTVHRVRAGETLPEIAALYGVPVDALLAANDLADPNVLSVGQAVVVPGVTAPLARQPAPAAAASRPTAADPSPADAAGADAAPGAPRAPADSARVAPSRATADPGGATRPPLAPARTTAARDDAARPPVAPSRSTAEPDPSAGSPAAPTRSTAAEATRPRVAGDSAAPALPTAPELADPGAPGSPAAAPAAAAASPTAPARPAEGGPVVTASPIPSTDGGAVAVRARGFPASTEVHVGFGAPGAAYEVLVDTATDADGRLELRVTPPRGTRPERPYVVVVQTHAHDLEAASEPFQGAAPPGTIKRVRAVTGILEAPVGACPLLRTDEGELFALTAAVPFLAGTRVTVVGSPGTSDCPEGTPLVVEDIEPAGAGGFDEDTPRFRDADEELDRIYRVEGTYRDGVECPELVVSDGTVWGLTGVDLAGAVRGSSLVAEGTRARVSFCGTEATLLVRSLEAAGGASP